MCAGVSHLRGRAARRLLQLDDWLLASVKSVAVLLFLVGTAAISATYFAVDRYRANVLAQVTADMLADLGDLDDIVAATPEHRAEGETSRPSASPRSDVEIVGVSTVAPEEESGDAEILRLVTEMAESGVAETWSDFDAEGDNGTLTVVEPITASDQACVSCHNEIPSTTANVQPGDVLGAAVIEAPVDVDFSGVRRLAMLFGLAGAGTVLLATVLLVRTAWKQRRSRDAEAVTGETQVPDVCVDAAEADVEPEVDEPVSGSRSDRRGLNWSAIAALFRLSKTTRKGVSNTEAEEDDAPSDPPAPHILAEVTGRVLIVDPDYASGQRVGGTLAVEGIQGMPVTSVVDAGRAADRLMVGDEKIDCVVVAQDPKATHHQKAIEFIRKYEPFRDTPIVFVDTSDQTVIGVHTVDQGYQKAKGGRRGLLAEILGLMERSRSGHTTTAGEATRQPVDDTPPEKPKRKKNTIDVLVCEDDEVNRLLMTTVLKKMGLTHVVAKRRADAVRFYQKRNPGIILVDVSSARLGGLQAVAEIRRSESSADTRVPILGIATETGDQVRDKCRKFGIDDLISKPVRFEEMQSMITEWTGN